MTAEWWLFVVLGASLFLLWPLLFGAPFVPSRRAHVIDGLALLNEAEKGRLLDLGSGDGRVALAAAATGMRVTAYEIHPVLWAVTRWRTRRYRSLVEVKWGDFRQADWPADTTAVFIFGMERVMPPLVAQVQKLPHPVWVASVGFSVPGLRHIADRGAVRLYRYDPYRTKLAKAVSDTVG